MKEYLGSDDFIRDYTSSDEQSVKKAIEAVHHGYFYQLLLVGFKMTGNYTASEDAVIDALMNLYTKNKAFTSLREIVSFLYGSIRDFSISYIFDADAPTEGDKKFQELFFNDIEMVYVQVYGGVMETVYGEKYHL